MGMNQVYTYIYEHCVKHSIARVIDELHKKSNCSSFLSKVSEPLLLVASIHSIIVNASLDFDTIKLLLDSVELLGQHFGDQIAEEFSPKKFLNLVHYIKALLVTNIILDDEIGVDEKVDELNKYFPADDDTPQSPDISAFDLNRVIYKRTQFRCYCLFFLASNKEPEDFLTPGQHQRLKGKVVQPAKFFIETVRGKLPETFIEKFCKKPTAARREMSFPDPVIREILFEMFGAFETMPTEDDILVIVNQMSKYIMFDPADILSSQESLDTMYCTSPSNDHWNFSKRQHKRPTVLPKVLSPSRAPSCPDYRGKVYSIKRTKKLIIPDGNCLLSRQTPRNIGSPRKRLSPPIVDGWWKDTNYLSKVRYRRSNGFPKVSADAKVVLNYTNVKPGQRVKVSSPLFENITVEVTDKSNKNISGSKSSVSLGTPRTRCSDETSRKILPSSPSIINGTRRQFKVEGKNLKSTSRPWKSNTGLNGSFWSVSSHKRRRKISQLHIRSSSRFSPNKTLVRGSDGKLTGLKSKAMTSSSTKNSHVDLLKFAKKSPIKNSLIRKESTAIELLRSPKSLCNDVDMNLKSTKTPIDYSQAAKNFVNGVGVEKRTSALDSLQASKSPCNKVGGEKTTSDTCSIRFDRKRRTTKETLQGTETSCSRDETRQTNASESSQASKTSCSRDETRQTNASESSQASKISCSRDETRRINASESSQASKTSCSRDETRRTNASESSQTAKTSCSRDETRRTNASESSQTAKTSCSIDETRSTPSSVSLQSVKSSNKDTAKRTTSESLQMQATGSSCSEVNSKTTRRSTLSECSQAAESPGCGVNSRRTTIETLHAGSAGRQSETKKRRVTLDSLHTAKTSCNKFQAKKRRTTLDSLHSTKTSCHSVETTKRTVRGSPSSTCANINDGPATLRGNIFMSRNRKFDMHSRYDPDWVAFNHTTSSGDNFLRSRFGKVKMQSRHDPDWVASSITSPDDAVRHRPSARLCVKALFSYKEPDLDFTADDEVHTDISDASSETAILKNSVETRSSKSCSSAVSSCDSEIKSSASGAKSEQGRKMTPPKEEGVTVTLTRMAKATSHVSRTIETCPKDHELVVHTCSNGQRQQTQTSQDKLVDKIRIRYRNIRRANRPLRKKRKSARTGGRIKTLIAQSGSSDFYRNLKKSYRKSYRRICKQKSRCEGSDESVDLDTSTDFSDFSDSELKLSGNVLLRNSQSTDVEKMTLMGQSGPGERDYLLSYRRSLGSRDMAKGGVLKDKTTCGVNPECTSECEFVQDIDVSKSNSVSTRGTPPFRKVLKVTGTPNNVRNWQTPDLNKPRTRNHSGRRKTMYLRSSKDPRQPQRYVEMGEWLIDSKFRKYHASVKEPQGANGQHRLTKSLPHRRSQRMTGTPSTGSSPAVPNLGRFRKAPFFKPCTLKLNRMNVPHLNKKERSRKEKK